MPKGFVYALSNPSFPDLLKIGFSASDPTIRADKLYSTGVPTKFDVAYYCLVQDAKYIEQKVHAMLSSRRNNDGREFFAIDLDSLKTLISSLYQPNLEYTDPNYSPRKINHDIKLSSRHGNENKENELRNFSDRLDTEGLTAFVQEAFYDSNSRICSFTFSGNFQLSDELAQRIYAIAEDTISQFDWFNSVRHGNFIQYSEDINEL